MTGRSPVRTALLGAVVLVTMLLAPLEPTAAAQVGPTQSSAPCNTLESPVELTSTVQAEDLLTGVWVRCNGNSIFAAGAATDAIDVGIEFVGGRFNRLYEAADGSLIRAEGADQEGTTAVIDTSAMNGPGFYQLNLEILGDGMLIVQPGFFGQPEALRLRQDGQVSDYVPFTGPPPTPGDPPGTGTGPCDTLKGPVALTSTSQVDDLLVGSWVRCDGDSLFAAGTAVDVGIEFADGRFYRLYRAADGSLVRAGGADQEGTTRVLSMSAGAYQLNLEIAGDGTTSAQPLFFSQPDALRLNGGMPGTSGDYVRWSGGPPTPGAVPGAGTGPCDNLKSPVDLTSAPQVQGLVTGTWVRCKGDSPFGTDTGTDVGVEFVDGRFYRLYPGPDGTLTRGEGPGQEGSISISDNATPGEPGLFQLNLEILGGGTNMFRPFLFDEPKALRLSGMAGTSDYVAWAAPTPPTEPPVTERPEAEPPETEPPETEPPTSDGHRHHRHHRHHHCVRQQDRGHDHGTKHQV